MYQEKKKRGCIIHFAKLPNSQIAKSAVREIIDMPIAWAVKKLQISLLYFCRVSDAAFVIQADPSTVNG